MSRPVVLEGVERLNPVYVTPYALSGPSLRNSLDDAAGAWVPTEDWTRDVDARIHVLVRGQCPAACAHAESATSRQRPATQPLTGRPHPTRPLSTGTSGPEPLLPPREHQPGTTPPSNRRSP